MTRWAAARRRRQLSVVVGAAAVVGLVAAFLVPLCSAPNASRLEVTVLTAPGSRRGDPSVGDVLHVRARVDRAHADLRVYLGTKLVARCAAGEPCQRDASAMELDWKLVEAGTYQIVMLSSASDIPVPADGALDRDLLEARSAGASIEVRRLTVSP